MIREFDFRLNYDDENIDESRCKQAYDDAQQFCVEFFYLSRYIQDRLKKHPVIKAMKKEIPKDKHILYFYFGINYKKENFRYDVKERVLFYQGLFDYNKISLIRNTNQRADVLLSALAQDVHKCEGYIGGITNIVHDIIDEFKRDNYKNIWEFSKKRIKGVGTAKLMCELTPLRFYLRLIVENKNKEVIFNQLLFTSFPDSLCYHHRFNSIVIDENTIIIPQRLSEKPLYSISIDRLTRENMTTEPFHKEDMPRLLIALEQTIDYSDHVRYECEYK